MSTIDDKLDGLKEDVIKLKVKVEMLETQDGKLEKKIDDLSINIDKKLDKQDHKLDQIIEDQKLLKDDKNKMLGGWKAITILIVIVAGLFEVGKFVIDFIKP